MNAGIVREVHMAKNDFGRWYWELVGVGKRKLGKSSGYRTRVGCLHTAKRLAAQLGVELT